MKDIEELIEERKRAMEKQIEDSDCNDLFTVVRDFSLIIDVLSLSNHWERKDLIELLKIAVEYEKRYWYGNNV